MNFHLQMQIIISVVQEKEGEFRLESNCFHHFLQSATSRSVIERAEVT